MASDLHQNLSHAQNKNACFGSLKTPVTCQQEDILDHEDVSFLTSLGPGGNSEGPQDSSLFLGLSCP